MNEELLEALGNIGLTQGEAKVYLSLLSVGTSTVGPVIEKSGVSSSKVYLILDRLIRKGLAGMIVQDNKKLFTAAKPERILDYLEQEKKKIERNKENAEKIIPALNVQVGAVGKKPIVEIAKGKKGFESFFDEFFDSAKEGDVYVTLAGQRISFKMQSYWYGHSVRMSHKKIIQLLTYDHICWFKKDPEIHKRKKRKLYYPKLLDKKFSGLPNIETLGNYTIMNDFDEGGEVFTMLIRNRNLTNAFRKLVLLVREFAVVPEGFKKEPLEVKRLLTQNQ